MKRSWLAPLFVLLLAGCSFGGGDGRAPVTTHTIPTTPPAQRTIGVQPGDTVYDLARRYDVAVRDLIEVNQLQPPYAVSPGTRLRFPVPRDYVVQAGDSLYGISRLFAVDQREIVRLNQLREPYEVKPGQTLRLPVRGDAPVTRLAAAAPLPAPPAPTPQAPIVATPLPPAPVPGVAVKPTGEGVVAPSRSLAPSSTPATAAPLPAPQPTQHGGDAVAAPTLGAPRATALAPSAAVHAATPSLAAPAVQPAPEAAQVASVAPAPVPSPKLGDPPGGRFVQPVAGRLLSGYGPKPDGLHNDGVNIAAPQGTPVKAADRGTVVYAGNELRGFGNLVLLKHEDGYVTAYAHLDRIDVAKGDSVARGQRIGTVGRTGSVSEPQLHFELRRGAKAIDPSEALKGG
jgi:murein DD-endopeptidase MepM/ murein hydrolase activator NlpD